MQNEKGEKKNWSNLKYEIIVEKKQKKHCTTNTALSIRKHIIFSPSLKASTQFLSIPSDLEALFIFYCFFYLFIYLFILLVW